MGAEVIVFTNSSSKVEEAKRLGANEAILSSDTEQMTKYNGKLHFILDTVSAKHDVNVYLNLLRQVRGLALIGLPPEPLEVDAFSVIHERRSFVGFNIGGIAETREMLDFCFKHNKITAESKIHEHSRCKHRFRAFRKR